MDTARCQERVTDSEGFGMRTHQCYRRWTVEDKGQWCKQHSPAAKTARNRASDTHYTEQRRRHMAPYDEAKRLRTVNKQLLEALEGHHEALGHDYEPESTSGPCETCDLIEEARK